MGWIRKLQFTMVDLVLFVIVAGLVLAEHMHRSELERLRNSIAATADFLEVPAVRVAGHLYGYRANQVNLRAHLPQNPPDSDQEFLAMMANHKGKSLSISDYRYQIFIPATATCGLFNGDNNLFIFDADSVGRLVTLEVYQAGTHAKCIVQNHTPSIISEIDVQLPEKHRPPLPCRTFSEDTKGNLVLLSAYDVALLSVRRIAK
jgi:hypothetical protein